VHRRFDDPGWNHHAILGDPTGGLWLLGNLPWGIQRYRDGEVEFLPMPRRDAIDVSLSASFDREGNLWIGTGRSGLQRLTPRKITTYSTADGLAHDNVWSIFEGRDGSMWIGTDGGVTRFKAGQSTLVTRADGSVQRDVRAVAEDRDGNLWVGTMRSLECTRDGVTRPVQFPGEWFETKIRVLLPGQDGSMWVGTVRGLTRLQGDQRTKYTRAEGLGSDEVRAMLEDPCRQPVGGHAGRRFEPPARRPIHHVHHRRRFAQQQRLGAPRGSRRRALDRHRQRPEPTAVRRIHQLEPSLTASLIRS
jgi:ligand-binding sensor domain-containing protein